MRSLILAASLLFLPTGASALCQCACVGGQMRAVCPAGDLVAPICQGLCGQVIQPERVITPLAGGRQDPEADPSDASSIAGQGSTGQGLAAGAGGRF